MVFFQLGLAVNEAVAHRSRVYVHRFGALGDDARIRIRAWSRGGSFPKLDGDNINLKPGNSFLYLGRSSKKSSLGLFMLNKAPDH
jgi:hypothetical protein